MSFGSYATFFAAMCRAPDVDEPQPPHPWQAELAAERACRDRLIRIPTGFGKTFGVLGAWLWNAVEQRDPSWPRRLVWCLPMRVLVEQTEAEVRAALERLDRRWHAEGEARADRVGVHLLMGGADADEWQLYPEHHAVLIGTQDMLLSRALNRGYGAPRARWPMEFGLLNHDALWVMDEVQLMDVGLATSAQLQAFRDDDACADRFMRPCHTWWMSATLQSEWLQKSPDTRAMTARLPTTRIPEPQRVGPLWEDVRKPCRLDAVSDTAFAARNVAEWHAARPVALAGPTLVVLNTVDRAVAVFQELQRIHARRDSVLRGVDLRLVHSRFRPHERRTWREAFLNRAACGVETNRIIVATQVIEAGVDLSAGLLVAELAPWPNVVQRFGRCARWGGEAHVRVLDFQHASDAAAAPYAATELQAARDALAQLSDVSPRELERFEEAHPDWRDRLYPYDPPHLLLRQELDELFDTAPDLSGADVDVSRFIRSGDERDVQVFWVDVPADTRPSPSIVPMRDALCSVPFLKARDWLCDRHPQSQRWTRLKAGKRAWVWDWLDGDWKDVHGDDIFPGRVLLVAAASGGYDPRTGWNDKELTRVVPVAAVVPIADPLAEQADGKENGEELSIARQWQTIATHGRAVGQEARTIAEATVPSLANLLDLVGRWHDVGKAHPCFQDSIRPPIEGALGPDVAKAPHENWLTLGELYPDKIHGGRRVGFRHELASVLALFAILQRHAAGRLALLGPWQDLLDEPPGPASIVDASDPSPTPLEEEILALGGTDFDLAAYLVCAHHGKVRAAWHASTTDREEHGHGTRIRGVASGDQLPAVLLADADGKVHRLPPLHLDLSPASIGLHARTGASWTERVLGLLARHGPFTLAWLEALIIAADRRASRVQLDDPLLAKGDLLVRREVTT